jgi:hypothetical protein
MSVVATGIPVHSAKALISSVASESRTPFPRNITGFSALDNNSAAFATPAGSPTGRG